MNEEIMNIIKQYAEMEAAGDDPEFNAMEFSGGNYDDAYSMGFKDGKIYLAKTLLDKID